MRDRGLGAVAVAFLFSYKNPAHELRAREILLEELGDGFPVSVSHEAAKEWREYERTSSAVNASYLGGTHLNDVTIFGPVFVGPTLVGFTASRAHWIDVGSKDPGGSMDSVSIFQEGLRLGPQKLVPGGVDERAVMDTISTNVRFPYPTTGDMHAMIACIKMGEKRL